MSVIKETLSLLRKSKPERFLLERERSPQEWKDFIENPVWLRVQGAILERLHACLGEFENAKDEADIAVIQGNMAAYNDCFNMPELALEEGMIDVGKGEEGVEDES